VSLWRATVQSPYVLAAGLAVSLAILGYIAATRRPVAYVADPPEVVIDPAGGPCHASTWERVCADWTAAGWPSCTVAEGGTPVVELTPALASLAPREHLRGAVVLLDDGRRAIAIDPDACSTPTPLHEVGHLYGLPDGGPTGSAMASPASRTGWTVPRYGGAP
jgi:hypothetical protein